MYGKLIAATVVGLVGEIAWAQSYSTGFEAPVFNASAAGTPMTGQDGWYIPPVIASVDYRVMTYAGNAYGFAPNPAASGAQFVAGRSGGGSALARSQRDVNFVGGEWTAAWDVAVRYDGVLPSAPNLGSFSLQPEPGTRTWQTLFNWFNVATAGSWRCTFIVYDAAGVEISPPLGVLPSNAWTGLVPNTWYRMRVKWSFTTNRVTEMQITNLATGATTIDHPVEWYLGGGASPSLALPPGYRLFTGGAIGNMVAWDNLSVTSGCYPDCNADGALTVADFGCFQTKFVAGDPYADCNGDGLLTVPDFGCFQTKFVAGCP